MTKHIKGRQRASGGVYELSFVTGQSLLDLLFGRPSYEAQDAIHGVVDVLRRIMSGAKPLLCMTCDHAFERDLPPVVMIAKPFASRRGRMIVSPVCAACAAQGSDALIAGCLEAFREGGMSNVREITAGKA